MNLEKINHFVFLLFSFMGFIGWVSATENKGFISTLIYFLLVSWYVFSFYRYVLNENKLR